MDANNRELDGEEEGVPQQADPAKADLGDLYRFARVNPDAILGLLRELSAILVEKGLLDEEEVTRILKGGIERWQNQK